MQFYSVAVSVSTDAHITITTERNSSVSEGLCLRPRGLGSRAQGSSTAAQAAHTAPVTRVNKS